MASTIVAIIIAVIFWVIIEESSLTQATTSCLDPTNDTSTCCQCPAQPVVYHCPGAVCLQVFYPVNDTVGNCTAGTTPNTTTTANALSLQYVTCAPCHQACATCTDQGPDNCLQCDNGYTRQNNTTGNCTKTATSEMEVDLKIIVIGALAAAVVFLLLFIVGSLLWNRHTTRKYHRRLANRHMRLEDPKAPTLSVSKTSGHLHETVEISVCSNEVYEFVEPVQPCQRPLPYPLSERTVDSVTHKSVSTRVSSSDTEPAASRQITLSSSDIEKHGEQRRASETSTQRETDTATRISRSLSQADTEAELHDIAADSSCDGCCLSEGPPGQHKSAHDKTDDLWIDLSDTSLCCTDSAEGAANSCHSVKDVPGSSDRSRRSHFCLFDRLPINKGIMIKTDSVDSIDSSPTVTSGYGTSLSSQQSSKCSTLESTTPMKLSFPMLAAFAEQSTRSDSFSRSFTHTLTSATQTAWSDVEIDVTSPVFRKEWQFCGEFSSAGGVLQGQHSEVMLNIAENTVEKGTRLTIRGAVCTDIERVHETLELPSGEFIRSPVIEYFAGKGYKFQKPVWVVLPHFLPSDFSPENVRVYRFNKGTSGATTVESLRIQSQQIGFQDADLDTPIGEDTGVYFFGENNTICILTDHFSGYFCTHCKQTHEPPVLILQLFAKHVETEKGERLVHIRLEVWDNRLKIKDFRENTNSILARQMQLVDELKHLPRVENEGDLAEVALGMRLELPSADELQWSHCERQNGEIVWPVEETIEIKNLCQCQPAIPHRKDWKLTNRRTVTPDFFSCIVDVGYVTCRATPMQFEKTLGFQTFDVRIPKSLEAACTAAEPLASPHCVIRRANHVFLSAHSSSSSSSRRPSDVMSESAAASESDSVVSGASELSSSVSSSTGDR